MQKEIYTPAERHLIEGVIQLEQAMETKKKTNALLELDMMLLAMEEKQDMMDGLKMEVYLL